MHKLVFIFLAFFSCSNSNPIQETEKYKGVCLVSMPYLLEEDHLNAVQELGSDAVAIIPYSFLRSPEEPTLIQSTYWKGETAEGTRVAIEVSQQKGLKIMLKPHIWIGRGSHFTGNIDFATEEDWAVFEETYKNYILTYAKLGAEYNVELLCIGTELENFVTERTDFWKELIEEIRTIYSGKLTYAANWDEFERVPIWDKLDYIGVDAYFPVSDEKTPSVEDVRAGWGKWDEKMKNLSEKHKKQILFTEYGYRNVDFAGKEPWQMGQLDSFNYEAQSNLYKAFFQEIWPKDYFAGGFIWKWFPKMNNKRHEGNQFTPQGKPAEETIREYYSNEDD